MSPNRQRLSQIANAPIPRPLLFLGAMIPLVGLVAAAARFVTQSADNRYTLADSLHVYQQSMALQHQRDSLIIDAKFASLKTPLDAMYRACERKGECP